MANIGYIQVNRHCNNACHFCSNPSNGESISYERGIELIEEFRKKEYQGVIFTGGEPTLSPNLTRWIEYTTRVGMECRVISNGMMCASESYTQKLAHAGLKLVHFSVYSFSEKIHDFLTNTPGSWRKLMQAIQHALKYEIRVQMNMVINRYNQDHLDKTVKFIVYQFPQIQHFVWNNIDPLMMRKTKVALSTLPQFDQFEASLGRAMQWLQKTGRTFRVERVPLCRMKGFEHCSTETRKIVKNEERTVYFLDQREMVHQKGESFFHEKLPECSRCDVSALCAGIYERAQFFATETVVPMHLTEAQQQKIRERIHQDDH